MFAGGPFVLVVGDKVSDVVGEKVGDVVGNKVGGDLQTNFKPTTQESAPSEVRTHSDVWASFMYRNSSPLPQSMVAAHCPPASCFVSKRTIWLEVVVHVEQFPTTLCAPEQPIDFMCIDALPDSILPRNLPKVIPSTNIASAGGRNILPYQTRLS